MGESEVQGQGKLLSDPASIEADLKTLVEILVELGKECDETAVGSSDPGRHNAVGFAFKLSRHVASALTLIRTRSSLSAEDKRFLDPASLLVLARAGWETFLLFHHIFIDAADESERAMRHRRWLIEGVRSRQSYEVLDREQERQKKEELDLIRAWEDEIRGNPAFRRLGPGRKKSFLEGKWWHAGWRGLAARARISKQFGCDAYSHLCDHAHSGPFSIVGQGDDDDPERVQGLRLTVAGILAVAVANTIAGLEVLFPGCGTHVGSLQNGLVDHWVRIGQGQVPPASAE